jgi:serine/threonine protein kinase
MREYKAFGREASLLHHFTGCRAVVDLLDCGFVSDAAERPVSGEIVSFGRNVGEFCDSLTDFHRRGWRPYLSETLMPEPTNLFVALRENMKQKRYRLPTEEGLALSMQYADLLYKAHTDDIVYLDVKLEHVYWDGSQLCLIDWNSSKRLSDVNSYDEDPDTLKKKDISAFAIGVMYPLFTGMPPQGSRFFEQPSNVDEVAKRYNGVRTLDFEMESSLAPDLVQLIRSAAASEYSTVQQFKEALELCAFQHGWPLEGNGSPVITSAVRARKHMRTGLQLLRQAQAEIQQARGEIMEAAEEDPVIRKEAERLIELLNELWKHRVIP